MTPQGENERLLHELRQANERLAAQNRLLRKMVAPRPAEIVGDSEAIHHMLELVDEVAVSPATVLVEGEIGTGKELVARTIHAVSPRAEELFIVLHCGKLSERALESELFGHRRGDFPGAVADRQGLFEVADRGTLFLDEIGNVPLGVQAKLLRALEERAIGAAPDAASRPVDVRVIAATSRRLEDEVKAGRFREDLSAHLRACPIRVPPLRERPEDIPPLARHLMERLALRLDKWIGDFTSEALNLLCHYPFPGNVRELRNEIERAILLAEPGEPLGDDLLSDRIHEGALRSHDDDESLRRRTADFERGEIGRALAAADGERTQAAAALGLTPRALAKKMRRLGMT